MLHGQAKQLKPSSAAKESNVIERALMGVHASEVTLESSLPPETFDSVETTREQAAAGAPHAFPKSEKFSFGEEKEEDKGLFQQRRDNLQDKLSQARYIGGFIKKYLIFEADHSLLIVDQHAAQERIVFEKLCQQLASGHIEIQPFLSPLLIKLSPQELLNWEEAKEKLEGIGIASTLWDKETLAIHAYPQLLKDAEKAVRDLLSGDHIIHCDHATIARQACRASVMAGDSLNKEQAEFQRHQLLQCTDPFTCPHGRPTIIEITEGFLDKQFFRT
jgi:DNA mismatch repair protein MutL